MGEAHGTNHDICECISFTLSSVHLLSIVSARPNLVKLAAIVHALKEKWPEARHTIIHTGQHYDPLFSDVFIEQLGIPAPDHNLGVKGDGHEDFVENVRSSLLPLLSRLTPDLVLLYGDVNGTMGAARAAGDAKIPMAHIEAGLRSFDLSMPEERNRLAIDAMSTLLFCSEQGAVANLAKEGITEGVHFTGNTMIDTLIRMLPLVAQQQLPFHVPEIFGIVTLHRPSNVDPREALESNLAFLADVSERCPLILPLHHRTVSALERFHLKGSVPPRVQLVSAMGYLPFLALLKRSSFILTDSGGVQEEATSLRKRCFTLRKNTERPSTIESGSNTLIDLEQAEDRSLVLDYATRRDPPAVTIPALWDGQAGARILAILKRHLHAC